MVGHGKLLIATSFLYQRFAILNVPIIDCNLDFMLVLLVFNVSNVLKMKKIQFNLFINFREKIQ